MKFANIIREAGLNLDNFEKCTEISINLYDEKDKVNENNDVHFVEPLFSHNSNSLQKFQDFLVDLEKSPVSSMNIEIDENYVVVFYKKPNPKFFSRK